jgi:hypothetical protein
VKPPDSDKTAPCKAIPEEFLMRCWNTYAAQMKEERPRMAVTLRSVKPVVSDCTILIELNNGSQLEDFNTGTKNDLEAFLRREMQNNGIMVEARLAEPEFPQQVKLYTSEEKFKYLSKKNPVLLKLKQDLNLELE